MASGSCVECFFCSFGQHKRQRDHEVDILGTERKDSSHKLSKIMWGLVCFGNNTVLLVIIQKFFTLKLNQFQV